MSGIIIGDCIIDAVVADSGSQTPFPGGAGLNLAVGVARLGVGAGLIARVGADRDGFFLRRYLREKDVRLIEVQGADFTGVAYSRRSDGEPSYSFNPAMLRRRIALSEEAVQAIAGARFVAVNSFPLEADAQVGPLVDTLARHARLVVLDPNPRPALICDPGAFRAGLARVAEVSDLLKISEEDIAYLFAPGADPQALFAGRIGTIVLTRGAQGARILMRDGWSFDCPVSSAPGPVIDTMGAGDATLASILAHAHVLERLPGRTDWPACLKRAMDIAAATCRKTGAEICLPPSEA